MKKEPYVGVVGPSEASEHERALAYAVGRHVAQIGGVVVCGGLGGVMEAAARGAREADPPGRLSASFLVPTVPRAIRTSPSRSRPAWVSYATESSSAAAMVSSPSVAARER